MLIYLLGIFVCVPDAHVCMYVDLLFDMAIHYYHSNYKIQAGTSLRTKKGQLYFCYTDEYVERIRLFSTTTTKCLNMLLLVLR